MCAAYFCFSLQQMWCKCSSIFTLGMSLIYLVLEFNFLLLCFKAITSALPNEFNFLGVMAYSFLPEKLDLP